MENRRERYPFSPYEALHFFGCVATSQQKQTYSLGYPGVGQLF